MKKLIVINILKKVLLLCLVVPGYIKAQDQLFSCTDFITLSMQVSNFKVYTYPPNSFVGMNFTDKEQVKNLFPEELLASCFSANTQEWVDYNELTPHILSSDNINIKNKADRKKNIVELLQKIEFNANGTTYAILKFRYHLDGAPKAMIFFNTMVLKNNRWVVISERGDESLLLMIRRVQSKYLNRIFNIQKSDNDVFNKLLHLSMEDNRIDLNKFLFYYDEEKWSNLEFMQETETEVKTLTDSLITHFSEYKSEPKPVQLSFPLSKLKYCEFYDDTNMLNDTTYFGKIVLAKEKLTKRTKSSLTYIHKLDFDYKFQSIEILKYKVKTREGFISKLVWLENGKEIKPISELKNLQPVVQYLQPKSFWAFQGYEKSGISEIDVIKSKFKPSIFDLDLYKLGLYLITKPQELSKYCDFD